VRSPLFVLAFALPAAAISVAAGLPAGLPASAGDAAGFAPRGWKPVAGARVAADLDGDGRADLAFLLEHPDAGRLLVVALGAEKGYRRIAAGAGPLLERVPQPRLRAAKNVLVLEQLTDGPNATQALHRFRYDAASGRMRLIGEDIESYTRPLREDTHKVSTNWLTGERIVEIGVEKGGQIAATRAWKSRVPVRTLYLEDTPAPELALSEAVRPYLGGGKGGK
jgi:hypothetical protein